MKRALTVLLGVAWASLLTTSVMLWALALLVALGVLRRFA